MRSNFWTETKVGLFVILGVVILGFGISTVGKYRWGSPKGYVVTAAFHSIAGLEEKAPVRIAGVRVGEVEKIFLKDGLAYVRMRLNPEARMRDDSEVTVSSLGLLGEKYVEVTPGSMNRPPVPEGTIIAGKDLVSIDRLISQFTEIAADIKAVTASLRSFLGSEESASPISDLVKHFDSMVLSIDGLVSENRAGIGDAVSTINRLAGRADDTIAENREDVRLLVRNLRAASEQLQTELTSISAKIGGVADGFNRNVDGVKGDLSVTLDGVNKAAGRVGDAAASLQAILDNARAGQGTVGKLLTDDSAYRNIDRAASALADVGVKLRAGEGTLGKLLTDDKIYTSFNDALDSVGKYLGKADDMRLFVGFRSEYLTEFQEAKSYFSLRVEPRPNKFYLLEAVDDPRGKLTKTTITDRVTVDGVTTDRVLSEDKVEDKLKFTVLLGRRFGDVALRGGLVESTGGGGADWWFSGDRGRISFDAWDFNRDSANPHLKATASYKVFREVFLSAGVDDVIETDRRSFFLGAGILFSDDDIKYLFGLSGLLK